MSKDILFPVGRLVGGSLYKGQTKNSKGVALTFKDGSPRTEWSFGVAFAKVPGQDWKATEWGKVIVAEAVAAAPTIHQTPTFAWKVTDGDSAIPNKKGKKPCDREGHKGHWVLWFSGSYLPKIYNKDGTAPIVEPDAVKPGYFIQVFGSTAFNTSEDSPGMYMNYSMVAFNAYGPEIELGDGPDASAVGFGQGAAPAGATAAPVGGMTTAPASAPSAPAPSAPSAPSAPAPTGPQPTAKAWTTLEGMLAAEGWTLELLIAQGYVTPAPAAAPAPTGTVVTPAPDFMAAPSAPSAPSAPAPTGPQPTAKAWTTLEGMLAADGWTLELLIKEGYVTA